MNDNKDKERPTLDQAAAFINAALLVAVEANASAAVMDNLLDALRAIEEDAPPAAFPPAAMRDR